MPVNWLIESFKWQFLIQKIEQIKIRESIQAVFAGTAISIFTPNRIGDYLGRIFILKKGDRLDGTVATIVGNISQLLVTLIMGLMALFYYAEEWVSGQLNWPQIWIYIFRVLIIATLIALVWSFFKFPSIEKQLNKKLEIYKYPIIKHFNLLSEYSSAELLRVLILSSFRYLVYSSQFYLLLLAFGIPINWFDGFMSIFLIFFGITIVPSIAVAELGIRAFISLLVFQIIGLSSSSQLDLALVSATSALWLINIALASFIGGLFIFNLRFIRKSEKESELMEQTKSD